MATNVQNLAGENSASDVIQNVIGDMLKNMQDLLKQSQQSSEQVTQQIRLTEQNVNHQYQQLQQQFDMQQQFANLQFEILKNQENQLSIFKSMDIQQKMENLSKNLVDLELCVKSRNANNSDQKVLTTLQDLDRKVEQMQTKINQSDGNQRNFGKQAEKALDRLNNKISQHSFLNDENTKYSELNKEVVEVKKELNQAKNLLKDLQNQQLVQIQKELDQAKTLLQDLQNQWSEKSKIINELQKKINQQESTIFLMQFKKPSKYDSKTLYKVLPFDNFKIQFYNCQDQHIMFKVYLQDQQYKILQINVKKSTWVEKLNRYNLLQVSDQTSTTDIKYFLQIAGYEIKRLVMTSEDVKVDTIEIEVQTTNQGVQVFRGVLGFSLYMAKKFDIPIYITKEAADTLITNNQL